jgi:hypothetical protein
VRSDARGREGGRQTSHRLSKDKRTGAAKARAYRTWPKRKNGRLASRCPYASTKSPTMCAPNAHTSSNPAAR